MAADKTTILSWLADLSAAIVVDPEDLADVSSRIAVAVSLDAATFATEALSLTRIIAESVNDSAGFDRWSIAQTIAAGDTRDAMSVLLAAALSISGGRVDWPSRPQAGKARSRIVDAGDAALVVASSMGGDGADLYGWLSSLTEVASRLISDLAANAVPIVKVATGLSMPSTVLAYQLYGDANRAGALVDISSSATPLVMPALFDALAS
jgi:prophage DNA circulation protein